MRLTKVEALLEADYLRGFNAGFEWHALTDVRPNSCISTGRLAKARQAMYHYGHDQGRRQRDRAFQRMAAKQ